MKSLQILLVAALLVGSSVPGNAEAAGSAYKRGLQAEMQNDYDHAYEAFQQAYHSKPNDPKYMAAYLRLRFYAANEHVRLGQALRDGGKVAEALAEFQRAVEIDHSSFMAQQELRRTTDMARRQDQHEDVKVSPQSPLAKVAEEAEGPVELKALSTSPTNLRMTETADKVYKVLAKLAGVNVLFDPDYRPQRISVELNDVTPREALNMVALQTKTFWQAASPNTIFVAADTAGKRKDVQANVMKTFYLKNVSTPTELQEAANTVRGILDVSRIQLVPTQSAMVLRGTTAQLILAEKLLSDIDKPKSEVVIDIAVMQVSRGRLHTIGTNVPTSASIVMVPGAGVAGTGGSSGSSGNGGTFTLNSLRNLTADNFQVSIPGASFTFLMSDSNTKLIQNPEIRALDNEKATLKIGDRVPISTGSFQSGIGGGVNTQFQYLDVGVNVDITPHIHSEHEVTLKMVLEISSVTGTQNIGGISQPIIGQRRIEHEARLKDGEVNLIGGILEDTETQSLSGYPWIAKIPILKYLFGQETKDRRENEIVFAITPHIVRAQDLSDQNLRIVDVGTGSAVDVRRHIPATEVPASSAGRPRTPANTPSTKGTPVEGKESKPVLRPVPAPTAVPGIPTGRPTPAISGENTTPARDPSSTTASAKSPSDPCPFGQHLVQKEVDVYVCAFD